MENITKRDYFAIKILQKLMNRYIEPGYSDQSAIRESYRLADLMIDMRKYDEGPLPGIILTNATHSDGENDAVYCGGCGFTHKPGKCPDGLNDSQ